MNTLAEHDALLLGLDESWQVVDIELSLEEQRVRIRLAATGKQPACCSEYSEQQPLKNHAQERSSIAGLF